MAFIIKCERANKLRRTYFFTQKRRRGYAKAEKMVGTDWAINTSKLMATAKLMDGIDGSVNQVLTREKAAQMTLNAIKAPMVTYETKGSSISVNGAEINFGASVAKYETSTIAKDQNISTQKLTSGEYTVELGEKLYKDLKKLSTTDAFERSATEWKLKAESIGVYADDADLVYYKGTKIGDIYADLGLSKGISKTKVTMYVNGVAASYTSGTGYGANSDIVKGNQTKIGGNGVELDVYYDSDTDSVTFVLIETYVGKVAAAYKATSTKDAYVTLNVTPADGFTGIGGSFDTESFSKDDIVAYTYSNKAGDRGIQTMYLADKVSGTLSAYTTDGSVTVSGTKYDADKVSATNIKEFSQTVDKGSDVVLYLDANGYALYLDADTSGQYAVVLDYAPGSRLEPARVKLLFTDGTTKKVDLDKAVYMDGTTEKKANIAASFTNGTNTANELSKYDIVSYTISSDGYKLTLVADAAQTSTSVNDKVITNGSPAMKFAGTTLPADGETIFLTETKKSSTSNTTYSVYEGIANVPTAKMLSDDETWYAAYKKAGDTKNSVVKLGGSVYAYGKDVKVYMINVEGDVNAIDVTSIGEDANDLVWFKLNNDDIVTDLYIKVVDTAEGVTTPVAGYSATVKASLAQVAVKGPDSTGDFDKVKTVAANALVASGYEVTKVEGTTISGLKFTVKNVNSGTTGIEFTVTYVQA